MTIFRTIQTITLSALTLLLLACGSGSTVKEPFVPTRVVVFGDALSDMTTGAQYTVNGSGAVDNWAAQVAASYSITTIVKKAAGNAKVADLAAQTAGFAYLSGDLVLINAGFRDLIDDAQANTNTATAKGDAYAEVIRSMVAAGAKHIAVSNIYDISKTPYGKGAALVRAFNDALKANLGSATKSYIGDNVRLIDTELYMNLVVAAPASYGFTDATSVVCTLTDSNLGIGTDINAKLCTASNVGVAYTSTYNNYVFADKIYPTPAFHRALGGYAYSQIVARW